MAPGMIYVHEVHDVAGGRMDEFGEAVRTLWRPLLEERGDARLLWFWELAHGTSASYQAVSLTAVRDWSAWGACLERTAADPRFRDWQRRVWTLRREVTAKILLPTAWSPLAVDLAHVETPRAGDRPSLYLHDTGWPFAGMLEAYAAALGSVFYPQTQRTKMISVAACWTVAPGTGRHHEVVLLQKIEDWERFARLLAEGAQGEQRGGWMEEGLRYRERWESKLLRCAAWSPRQ
jgi:hypothetical protein